MRPNKSKRNDRVYKCQTFGTTQLGRFFEKIIERIEVQDVLISPSSNLRSNRLPKRKDLNIIPWLMIDISHGRLRCPGSWEVKHLIL